MGGRGCTQGEAGADGEERVRMQKAGDQKVEDRREGRRTSGEVEGRSDGGRRQGRKVLGGGSEEAEGSLKGVRRGGRREAGRVSKGVSEGGRSGIGKSDFFCLNLFAEHSIATSRCDTILPAFNLLQKCYLA